jgi:rRNA small subunit pseudouridine methyltransferase Nep1
MILCNIPAQLLQKLSITAEGTREKLLNVIKNPVTNYLPVGARKIGEIFYLVTKTFSWV